MFLPGGVLSVRPLFNYNPMLLAASKFIYIAIMVVAISIFNTMERHKARKIPKDYKPTVFDSLTNREYHNMMKHLTPIHND